MNFAISGEWMKPIRNVFEWSKLSQSWWRISANVHYAPWNLWMWYLNLSIGTSLVRQGLHVLRLWWPPSETRQDENLWVKRLLSQADSLAARAETCSQEKLVQQVELPGQFRVLMHLFFFVLSTERTPHLLTRPISLRVLDVFFEKIIFSFPRSENRNTWEKKG